MTYQPIESYGMIGDMHTVALVGTNGSIDWLCVPDFDSPTVFAAILDHGKGGRFKIAPASTFQQTVLARGHWLVGRTYGQDYSHHRCWLIPGFEPPAPGGSSARD